MTRDEDLLVAWVSKEDRTAGNELIARYFGRIRRFFASKVNPTEVEDLVQRTFAGCVEHVGRFRAEASFATYIFSIARRQLYRHLRDAARDAKRNDADIGLSSIRVLGQSPSSVVARAESHTLLLRALQSLPVDTQTLLELHYWDGLGANELGAVLELDPGAVRTRLHRARARLRTALVEVGDWPEEDQDLEVAARALGLLV